MVRKNYTFSNSSKGIAKLSRENAAYASALDLCFEAAKYAREHFADSADRLSGWAHNFTCTACASQMVFDSDTEYREGNVFTCPVCGERASSRDHDEAWVYYYRSKYATLAYSVAISAIMGDAVALDFLIRYVDFYADNYESFPVHGKHAGHGKIMEQALDEAVWAIDVLSALNACGDLIPCEKRTYWRDRLFLPLTELIIPQAKSIHNIPTWLMCAVGAIGIYFGDKELLTYALDSEFGLRNQMSKGFTKDGIWYEGSMTYHYYTASALSGFFSFYASVCPEDKIFDDYARIYTAPLALSHDGRSISALNDGWYPNVIPMSLIAARVTGDERLLAINRTLISENPDSLDAKVLLFAIHEPGAVLMADTRLAVVNHPFHAILKAGVLSTSHMHRDYLSTRISPFSDDLGTPGYGHVLTKEWYRFHPAHNAIGIDLAQPTGVAQTYMRETEDGVTAGVMSGEWADLELAERTLTVNGNRIEDLTELCAPTEHIYDWVFHSKGEAEYSCDINCEIASLGEINGYKYLTNIKKMQADGSFTAAFTLDGVGVLTLTVPNAEGIEIYTAKSPDNPANNMRNTVVLRRKAKDARFLAVFERK